jgi:hypothetical protein
MTQTRVVHIRKEPYDVYIGRPSKWGNPFKIGPDGTREDVIRKYHAWVLRQPHLMSSLHELRGKRLGCFCKPQACHGDVLAALADGRTPPTYQSKLPKRQKATMLDRAMRMVRE